MRLNLVTRRVPTIRPLTPSSASIAPCSLAARRETGCKIARRAPGSRASSQIQRDRELTMPAISSELIPQNEFERLYQRSQRRAYNLAYRLTGNVADAEDVTQDAYVRAWHNFESYDSDRS